MKIAICAAVLSAALAGAAQAEVVRFHAMLDAKSESPPTASAATGMANATYDTATKLFTYEATYKDLSGPATAAHFHGPAAPGANAGPVLPIADAANIKGAATLTDAQAADLLAGRWYLNVHTAANRGGEIRGQLMKH
jgi:hypothetical protein